jgi:hypothetical protein
MSLPLAAQEQAGGSSVPLSKAWNIASTGKAASSGELLFRVTPGSGEDPVEVSVFVLSGSNETGIASSIRRALSTQLDPQSYDIEAGQGANVLITAEDTTTGESSQGFAIELLDSDVDDVRVMVRSAAPVAPPTVPPQNVPANPPNPAVPGNPATPESPGDATPQQDPQAPANPTPAPPAPQTPTSPAPSTPAPQSPASPPPQTPAPSSPASPSPAPGSSNSGATGGAGAPASAPPPPASSGGR